MIKLSTHEQKILNLIKENPEILIDPNARKQIADEHGMTEKTLRNRIGDLKRYAKVFEIPAGEAEAIFFCDQTTKHRCGEDRGVSAEA